jgi:hypothetical protein
MKKDMLNYVTKLIVFISFSLFVACNQQEQKNRERDQKILEVSRATIGKQEYNEIYQQTLDSLNTWCSKKLPGYQSIWSFKYSLDSVLCFNKEKDRMVTAILGQHDRSDCETDAVYYFYGAKIKGQWYFFQGGGTMVVLREHYQKDIHTPVSFEKLHELAMNNMLRGYVKRNKDGEWEVNDAFFTAHFEDSGWGNFEKQKPRDTLPNGKHFTDKKAYFESLYLRAAGASPLQNDKNKTLLKSN